MHNTQPEVKQEKGKRHIAGIIILSIASIAWITLILGFSSESAVNSSKRSGTLLVAITNVVAPSLGATIDNYQDIAVLQNCEKVLRKCAHMAEYGVLALLLWLLICEIGYFSKGYLTPVGIRSYLFAEVSILIVGTIDEINQTRFVGRYGSPVDVLVDGVGAAVVLLICRLIAHNMAKSKRYTVTGRP